MASTDWAEREIDCTGVSRGTFLYTVFVGCVAETSSVE
jgi:hypothetical protein